MSNDSKFGLKVYLRNTDAMLFAKEIDIFADSKIKLIVNNAGATNMIVLRGRIQGQRTWDEIGTIVGNETKEFNTKTYDFVQLECTTYDSPTNYLEVTGSGFNLASGGGLESISTPSGTLSDIETLEFVSTDSSVHIEAISPNQINLKLSGSAGNAFGNINTPDSNTVTANSFSDVLSFKQVSNSTVITSNPLTSEITFDTDPKIKDNVVITEKIMLTPTDITNKTVTLSSIVATPFKTRMTVVGGPEQEILADFTVSGNILGWSGTTLDGVLEDGDELIITHD